MTQHRVSQNPSNSVTSTSISTDDVPDAKTTPSEELRRTETGLSKTTKDKKNRVSFLSRFIGGSKKRDDDYDSLDDESLMSDLWSGGDVAEVFSHPIGYIPKFPAPPKYIRVRAQNRKKRDLTRLFLAQILLEPPCRKSHKTSIDSRIINIGDSPTATPPNSSKKTVNNAIWATEFSKDGKYFAAAGQDKKLRVWEVISKDNKDLGEELNDANSQEEQAVKLDAPVFRQRLIREYDGHTSAVLDLSWSKNNFLLSSSMDKTVRLYHVSREDCLCAFKHNDFVTSIQFHPRDDRFFLAGSLDAKLRLWSIPDKNVAYSAQLPDMITAVAFTPDGKTAIAGTLSGVCILYQTEGLKAHSQIYVRSTRGKNNKGSKITGIDTISVPGPQGQSDVKLLITSNDSRIRMYNMRDRSLELKFKGNENSSSQIKASFSDDGRFVICGSEDRKVYVWPTGPMEKPDSEKRPVEIFSVSSQIVTSAVFAPASTRRSLAESGDPIYDVCNPPSVVLLSRTDSLVSSPALTNNSGRSEDRQESFNATEGGSKPDVARYPAPVDSPSYLARHCHNGGHIIVTADYAGQIKVFREDCAYQKRRDSTWESGSTFSRKMLARTNSLTPRTSVASSTHRNSIQSPTKSPSSERIINWRNSISYSQSTANGGSEFSLRRAQTDRERSTSPRKTLPQRLSLHIHRSHISQATASSDHSRQPLATPDIAIQSPGGDHISDAQAQHAALQTPITYASPHPGHPRSPSILSPVGESPTSEQVVSPATETSAPIQPKPTASVPHFASQQLSVEENPLRLVGDHSYMAWDIQNTLVPMANNAPRTPGGGDLNPLSRNISLVSRLSSELPTPESKSDDGRGDASSQKRVVVGGGGGGGGSGGNNGPASSERKQSGAGASASEEEELRCHGCGSERFRMIKIDGGERGLKCRDCDTLL